MELEIHLGGSGGQGILLVGNLLAYGGLKAGLEVTWIPSYGAERRGGVSFCAVTLADQPIACPVTDRPGLTLVMDNRALATHQSRVKPGGVLLVNESLVTEPVSRKDLHVLRIPLNRIAEGISAPLAANVVGLGAILRLKPLIPLEVMRETLAAVLGPKKSRYLPANLQALEQGHAYAGNLPGAPPIP
jgi:2-oxoglutarate ferredoxin oxidoreductase subunit gamma